MGCNLLHIYAQEIWHDDVFIVASRDALYNLQAAINDAMLKGSARFGAFASDGEGYSIYVILLDEDRRDSWNSLRLPYTDECAIDRRDDRVHPYDLIEDACTRTMLLREGPCFITVGENADGQHIYRCICPYTDISFFDGRLQTIRCRYKGQCEFVSFVKSNGLFKTGLRLPPLPWYLVLLERATDWLASLFAWLCGRFWPSKSCSAACKTKSG